MEHAVRQEAVETVKAAPPVGYIAGTLAGIDWGTVASIMACLYTAWLLAEKAHALYQRWKVKRGR
jgi:hypothetical protein